MGFMEAIDPKVARQRHGASGLCKTQNPASYATYLHENEGNNRLTDFEQFPLDDVAVGIRTAQALERRRNIHRARDATMGEE